VRLLALSFQLSAFSFQFSAFSFQFSVFSFQFSLDAAKARLCIGNRFWSLDRVPNGASLRGLKPAILLAHGGTAEQAAEKFVERARSSPQALKRGHIFNDLRHE
jgi:hypothetical protein